MSVRIDISNCVGCNMCVMFCPEDALSVPGETFKCQVDQELCTDCYICIDYCPTYSIEEA